MNKPITIDRQLAKSPEEEKIRKIILKYQQIIFSCQYNAIRSPAAELIMKKFLHEKLKERFPGIGDQIFSSIEINSAGTRSTKADSIKREMRNALHNKFSFDFQSITKHKPRKIQPEILIPTKKNLILTMSDQITDEVKKIIGPNFDIINIAEFADSNLNEIRDPNDYIKNWNVIKFWFRSFIDKTDYIHSSDISGVYAKFRKAVEELTLCVDKISDKLLDKNHLKIIYY